MLKSKSLFILFFLSLSSFFYSQDYTSKALKHYNRGIELSSYQEWYEAAEEFLEAARENPAFSDAWYNLARCNYETNDFTLCLSNLENAEKYARDRTDILNLRGMCLISMRKLDEAEKVFKSILKDSPNNIEARFGLAELELYNGSYDSAENFYLDALKRQNTNRKALLSLALLAAERGKDDVSQKYINQALRYHSAEAEVHYLCAYLAAKKGKLSEAERRARSAVQIKGDYTDAYIMLASILYESKRYTEVIDICDYLISKNRRTISAWYLKGLSQQRLNLNEEAVETWGTALSIDSLDEILRSALENLVTQMLPLEDERRSQWAQYHIKKAREHSKIFQGEEARYEYQRALKIDPNNFTARSEFAQLISKIGLNELYLNQITFIKNNSKVDESSLTAEEKYKNTKINDTIEAYTSLMKYSLNYKWNTDPFYLDKTRWNIGLFYTKSPVSLIHSDCEETAASMIQQSFSGAAVTSVSVHKTPVSSYGEAFKSSRRSGFDYFVIMTFEETEREVSLDAVIYNGRNGTEASRFSLFRTGNDRFASVIRSFRRNVLAVLPARGKIIARSGNEILIDMGKTEGLVKDAVLDVVKAGNIRTKDTGTGVTFDEKYSLGQIVIGRTGEEISEGTLTQKSFYDRVNIGDEVLVKHLPSLNPDGTVSDTNPKADENGNTFDSSRTEKLTAEDLGLIKTPAFIDLLRNLY